MKFAVALAPMAGYTDRAFRELCLKHGADAVTTEMVSAKGLFYGDKKTGELLDFSPSDPVGVQLFGSDPKAVAFAAAQAARLRPAFIDLNMGCPVPKIFSNGDGCALMLRPELAYDVIRAAVDASDVPVTVKFRLGVDETSITAVPFAQMCERAGAKAITLHARTRKQMYSGRADWSYIRRVKESVGIFVWGNGDVDSPKAAAQMADETGCDGVMIGRGALGNPFLFEQIKSYLQTGAYRAVSPRERLQTAIEQVEDACRHKPEWVAVPQARKALVFYLKGMRGAAACKTRLFAAESIDQIRRILTEFLEENHE